MSEHLNKYIKIRIRASSFIQVSFLSLLLFIWLFLKTFGQTIFIIHNKISDKWDKNYSRWVVEWVAEGHNDIKFNKISRALKIYPECI